MQELQSRTLEAGLLHHSSMQYPLPPNTGSSPNSHAEVKDNEFPSFLDGVSSWRCDLRHLWVCGAVTYMAGVGRRACSRVSP